MKHILFLSMFVFSSVVHAQKLVDFTEKINRNFREFTWKISNDSIGNIYILETGSCATGTFKEVARREAKSDKTNTYKVIVYAAVDACYRLKINNKAGEMKYSAYVSPTQNSQKINTSISNGQLDVTLPKDAYMISLHSPSGKLLLQQKIINNNGFVSMPLLRVPKGSIGITVSFPDKIEKLQIRY